jgi:hypothetical protein
VNLRGRRPRTLAVWEVKLADDVGDASVPFPFDMETAFMGRLSGVAACTDAGGDAEGRGSVPAGTVRQPHVPA